MKNKSWLRLTGWLLALVMILTVLPAVTFAEDGNIVESETEKSPKMEKRPEQVEISDYASTYTDAAGKAVELAAMDPNAANYMTLSISGLNNRKDIGDTTSLAITVPDNVTITELDQFSNDAVNAALDGNKLILSWKNGKQDAVDATFTVLPHLPTENDLSGTYALVTKKGVMLGSTAYKDGSRGKINSIGTSIIEGMITPDSTERSFWVLKHVSGDYYTVYSQSAEKYLRIVPSNHVSLTDTNENEAQKLLVTKTSDGYYTFRYDKLGLNNSGNNVKNGFASYTAGNADNEKFTLYSSSAVNYNDVLKFSINGGTGGAEPSTIFAEAGTKVTLPDLDATKSGQSFIGWADVKDIHSAVPGTKHTYHEVYRAGTSYTVKSGAETLYAVYNDTNTSVTFGIRVDGVIQDEPNGYSTNDYKGHFTLNNVLKETHWIIDINSTKAVNDYYVDNDITANLTRVPTAEEIKTALKKEGNIEFDPETQYVHWYVLKFASKWKIDGVIRNKASVAITYNINAPAGIDKTKVTDMPGSYQVTSGTDILIGADKDSTTIKRPNLKGYIFMGWNTKEDGTGAYYNEQTTIHLTENLNLYAQWIAEEEEPLEVQIVSDWPKGKMGYVGARITLTAKLIGFEGKSYTLCWQYSIDEENWVDVPDSNTISYTYILNETTTRYTWRVVARDIQ